MTKNSGVLSLDAIRQLKALEASHKYLSEYGASPDYMVRNGVTYKRNLAGEWVVVDWGDGT